MKIFTTLMIFFTTSVIAFPADKVIPMYPFYYREIECGKLVRVIITDKNRPGVIIIDGSSGHQYYDYDFDAAYQLAKSNNTAVDVIRGCE